MHQQIPPRTPSRHARFHGLLRAALIAIVAPGTASCAAGTQSPAPRPGAGIPVDSTRAPSPAPPGTVVVPFDSARMPPPTSRPDTVMAPVDSARIGNVVKVRMITKADGTTGWFEPATVTVRQGDIVRFITDGKTVHNVSFPPAENPGSTGLPAPGYYLTSPNQTFDLMVSVGPGTYRFQCDPHAVMGMKGVMIVQ